MSTDADRLEAAGIPLRLGERDVRVRFSMRSMKALEKRFGSLSALNEEVKLLLADKHPRPHDALTDILPAALLHEKGAEDALLDLAPVNYPACFNALIDAITVDFNSGKAPEGDQGDETSPGATSTTSPPSGSAEATASSGT